MGQKIYGFLAVISFLSLAAFAVKNPIKVNITNNSCEFPTKFKCTARYSDSKEEEISIVIPPKNEKEQLAATSTIIRGSNLQKLYLSLVEDNEEETEEVIAMETYTPQLKGIKSLEIDLVGSAIRIKEIYNLPPKFTEN